MPQLIKCSAIGDALERSTRKLPQQWDEAMVAGRLTDLWHSQITFKVILCLNEHIPSNQEYFKTTQTIIIQYCERNRIYSAINFKVPFWVLPNPLLHTVQLPFSSLWKLHQPLFLPPHCPPACPQCTVQELHPSGQEAGEGSDVDLARKL